MKKITAFFICCLTACVCAAELSDAVKNRNLKTPKDFSDAVSSLTKSSDPAELFALGAALADNPPPRASYENVLFGVVISSSEQGLRKFFAAVVLTSMNDKNAELLPMMRDAFASAGDPVLKGYAASAVSILNPPDKTKADYVISLYDYDKVFSLKALNALFARDAQIINALKTASVSSDVNVRKGAAQLLGTFAGKKSEGILYSMLAKERNEAAASDVAFSLSRMPAFAAGDIKKCLGFQTDTRPAVTCSLALGFMTGDGFPLIKESLSDKNENVQVNALRAAAVMAGVLGGKETSAFSPDAKLDKQNLKTLIPQTASLSQNSKSVKVREQASSALKSFSKLF